MSAPRNTRDLTKAQFNRLIEKYGFKPAGFMGYYSLPEPHSATNVSAYNAGNRRRSQLAYLLAQARKAEKDAA
jgi:hypothetical protein